jgi:hypothetical protein
MSEPVATDRDVHHKKAERRGSLVPVIHRWALSVNKDADSIQRQFLSRKQRSMSNQKESPVPLKQGEQSRRGSLDVNVERAVAMINEDPRFDEDDGNLTPFGTRRDSLLM